ncbi:YozQ family protein [Anoxybacteroides tepidamans]|uniref:YozQ family protein n=1 Tax=Anoxybacteroides tepidamans TaxID=265948 RepID=UPI000481E8CE|nr:YozQ family protein [Anoxybacillus tepidamans]
MAKEEQLKTAGRYYEPSDYQRSSFLSNALATTHEQVSDAYTEGTVDGVIDNVDGKDIPLVEQNNPSLQQRQGE